MRRILLGANISSKKKALEALASLFADELTTQRPKNAATETNANGDEQGDAERQRTLTRNVIFDAFTAREKLGSTGLENGIAVPHCRLQYCRQPQAAIMTTRRAIDYDALDGKPVNLFWALIVPEEANDEHLQILAKIAETLSNKIHCETIRSANFSDALYRDLCNIERAGK